MKPGLSLGIAGIVLLGSLSLSCDEKVTYSYFRITATVDPAAPQELLELVGACAAIAETPSHVDSADLGCIHHMVGRNLGVVEYSTKLTQGAIKFSVVMNGINQNPLAQGEVGPLDIVLGQTVESALVVKAIPGALEGPDAGTTPEPDADTSGGSDAGAPDESLTSDAAVTTDAGAADEAANDASTDKATPDAAATPDAPATTPDGPAVDKPADAASAG